MLATVGFFLITWLCGTSVISQAQYCHFWEKYHSNRTLVRNSSKKHHWKYIKPIEIQISSAKIHDRTENMKDKKRIYHNITSNFGPRSTVIITCCYNLWVVVGSKFSSLDQLLSKISSEFNFLCTSKSSCCHGQQGGIMAVCPEEELISCSRQIISRSCSPGA